MTSHCRGADECLGQSRSDEFQLMFTIANMQLLGSVTFLFLLLPQVSTWGSCPFSPTFLPPTSYATDYNFKEYFQGRLTCFCANSFSCQIIPIRISWMPELKQALWQHIFLLLRSSLVGPNSRLASGNNGVFDNPRRIIGGLSEHPNHSVIGSDYPNVQELHPRNVYKVTNCSNAFWCGSVTLVPSP